MFVCAADDGEAPRSAGCLCHTPGFARLNAHLKQKFSRHSSSAGVRATFGAFAAEPGGSPARAATAPSASIAFANARLFDGKSDALIEGFRVVVEGKTIKAVQPAEATLDPGAHGDFRFPYEIPASPDAQLSRVEAIGGGAIADGVDRVLQRAREQLMLGASQLKLAAGGGVSSH
jgi:hypothetical protein